MNNLFNKKTIIISIFEIILVLICLFIKGVDSARNYCDAFFIGSFTILAIGGFSWLSNVGTFDILSYSWITVKSSFSKSMKREYSTMYDYSESKKEKRAKNRYCYLPYVFCGGVGIVIAVIIRIFV